MKNSARTEKKNARIEIRCTPAQKARIAGLRRFYKYRSVSAMVLDWVIEAGPRMSPGKSKSNGARA